MFGIFRYFMIVLCQDWKKDFVCFFSADQWRNWHGFGVLNFGFSLFWPKIGGVKFWLIIIEFVGQEILLDKEFHSTRSFTGKEILFVKEFYWTRNSTGHEILLVMKFYSTKNFNKKFYVDSEILLDKEFYFDMKFYWIWNFTAHEILFDK